MYDTEPEKTDQKEIRVSSHSQNSVTIDGLSKEEAEKVRGAISGGMWWIRVESGKLLSKPNYEPPPDPVTDQEMLPFWRRPTEKEKSTGQQLFDLDTLSNHDSPSISIQHLCGFDYSPTNYKFEAEKLTSWGFECMRSRRGDSGQFWEIWFLPGLWCAKGSLEEHLKGIKGEKKKMEAALKFLSRRSSFGTLDVSVQRMAAVHD